MAARSRNYIRAQWNGLFHFVIQADGLAEKKKNHFISSFVLRNFALNGKEIRVQPLDGRPIYTTAPDNLGHRNNAHRVAVLELDMPTEFEDIQGDLESDASRIIRRMLTDGHLPKSDDERELLEKFLVLHLFRHPSMMKHVRESTDTDLGQFEGTKVGESLRHDLVIHAVSFAATLSNGRHQFVGDELVRWARYRGLFAEFTWNLVQFDSDSLVVGDDLVSCFRTTTAPTTSAWRTVRA